MRNHKACATLHHRGEGLLHTQLRHSVDVTGSLVQNQHGRIHQHYACDAQQLLLSLRQIAAVFRNHSIVAFREATNEAVRMCGLGSSDNLFPGRAGLAIADILRNRRLCQPRLLKHHAEASAQLIPRHVSNVHTAHGNAAVHHIIEPHQEVD